MGPLCARCTAGYTQGSLLSECSKCADEQSQSVGEAALVCVAFLVCVFLMYLGMLRANRGAIEHLKMDMLHSTITTMVSTSRRSTRAGTVNSRDSIMELPMAPMGILDQELSDTATVVDLVKYQERSLLSRRESITVIPGAAPGIKRPIHGSGRS